MADKKSQETEAQRWREKYFLASEELDKKEKDHADYLHILHRALVRISLAADGQNKALDKQLSELRNLLRKEPINQASINNNLSQIESALIELDNQRKDNGQQGFSSLQALVDQLLQLKLGKDKQRALKHYSKALANRADQLSSYPELLSEYSRLQREALSDVLSQSTEPQAPSTTSEGGFFARMFASKNESHATISEDTPEKSAEPPLQEASTPPAVSNQTSENDTENSLTAEPAFSTETNDEQTTAESDETQASSANKENDQLSAITAILADLLEQLPLAPEIRDQAEQLRDHLKELAAADQWDKMIDGTAELVIKALDKSQQEFEQFLLTLDQQLAQISGYLSTQGQNQTARHDATSELNLMVRNQVGSISKAVGEASDIKDLKNSVQNQLKTIVASMDEFVETETEREHALEKQLEVMQEQLTLARTESQSIRKKLQNETLRALTDTLTGLPNREAFDERFNLERERFLRYKHPASLAILDIDHFKLVNDNHGHLVGDRVLQAFATTVKNMTRSTDFLARFGGEEFVLIMPETDTNSAQALLEKIRISIAEMTPKNLGTQNPITVSSGLAAFQLGEKAEQLVERADKALYRAKDAGRNQVEIAE